MFLRPLLFLLLAVCTFAAEKKQFKAKTDIFGSVSTKFGTSPRGSYTLGIGHRFERIYRTEVNATYSYENLGTGFFADQKAGHTAAVGLKRSIHLPGRYTSFASMSSGSSYYTGLDRDPRTFIAATYGVGIHIHYKYTLSFSETYTKMETKPCYFTSGVGFSHGWWSISANANKSPGYYVYRVAFSVSWTAFKGGHHVEHPRYIHLPAMAIR